MQSGPIAAFSANAEKNACLRQASIRRTRHTFRQVPLHHAFRRTSVWRTGPIFSTRCHTPNGARTSDKLPYAEREGVNRLNVIRLPERASMQNRCHVRITGCSSFLTFHAGVESVGPLSRDRRPLKRNQLQKEADFLLLKTGARPKRNSRRDIGLCSCRDVGS